MEGKNYEQLAEEFTPMIHHMMKKLAIYKDKQGEILIRKRGNIAIICIGICKGDFLMS